MSQTEVPIVRLEGVTKTYGEGEARRHVLRDVSLTFTRGEFDVLLGKSGSGKSTLLNLIAGIDDATSGRIWIEGREMTAMGDTERTLMRRQRMGFIFQAFNLIPTLTVLENVTMPLELAGASPRKARDRANELLQAVGLFGRGKDFPDKLSGGEQQRVAIARALVNDPALVLADEPTGNLDADTGQIVLDLLDTLTRKAGRNLIMVTHSTEVVGVADHVYRLREGRLMPAAG
ncbi:MAG TPA: ABC transporter ATP-binding protein [Thermoflexales bacterium]|jgi:putative ABC transport system ATP-binding protein|nr:ABC transporter ATP-binding protein [Anaerolineae bacterium]HQV26504.1 ABC transporter ATP-binding protein [Thermoflexales bacterium]HQX08967.1 ABC transporter ATP-binding protein [Thermoflexales bacterium]HQY24792.1 ABC transporter ATP-binding protein [Thermoflexales bacterium]HQZ51858.1 ABC transporter ATP-binding protein [Thermoflexales bacterium]